MFEHFTRQLGQKIADGLLTMADPTAPSGAARPSRAAMGNYYR